MSAPVSPLWLSVRLPCTPGQPTVGPRGVCPSGSTGSGWYSSGSWFWGWLKNAFAFYSRKILENRVLTWSLTDPEEGVSSIRMSCLYSQCRRLCPPGIAVSPAGAGGCRGAGAIPLGGPPAPRDVDGGAPPASVSARLGPAEPWAVGDKPHRHLEPSRCQFSSVFWRY